MRFYPKSPTAKPSFRNRTKKAGRENRAPLSCQIETSLTLLVGNRTIPGVPGKLVGFASIILPLERLKIRQLVSAVFGDRFLMVNLPSIRIGFPVVRFHHPSATSVLGSICKTRILLPDFFSGCAQKSVSVTISARLSHFCARRVFLNSRFNDINEFLVIHKSLISFRTAAR